MRVTWVRLRNITKTWFQKAIILLLKFFCFETKIFLEMFLIFHFFLSYFCLWRSSRCVKSVNSARSSQKVENCTWNFSRCVGFFKEKFFSTFSWYFQIRTHFPQHTTKPTNQNYFDLDASEKQLLWYESQIWDRGLLTTCLNLFCAQKLVELWFGCF